MSEIPEDILKSAQKLEEVLDKGDHISMGFIRDSGILLIAEAILAERERCAKIADIEADRNVADSGVVAMWIAMYIRGEEEQK